MKHPYKFSFGPWNISNGADVTGPAVRATRPLEWKLEQLRKIGFEAMMLHDDDVVPDIDDKSPAQIVKEAGAVKRRFHDAGIKIDLVAPRLWSPRVTIRLWTRWSSII